MMNQCKRGSDVLLPHSDIAGPKYTPITALPHHRRRPEALSHMTSLRQLYLGDRPISDDGLAALRGLTGLEELHLNGTDITGTGLRHLEAMNNLRLLDVIACSRLTDEGLASLPPLPKLETLIMNGTGITGEGVNSLSRLKHLRQLGLSETMTSDEDARRLKAALPQCEITLGCLLPGNPLDRYNDGKWIRPFTSEKDVSGLEGCRFTDGLLEINDRRVEIPSGESPDFIIRRQVQSRRGREWGVRAQEQERGFLRRLAEPRRALWDRQERIFGQAVRGPRVRPVPSFRRWQFC